MWATSGRSMRRAPARSTSSARRRRDRRLVEEAHDREHRHPQLPKPSGRRRVGHDRLAELLLLRRMSRGVICRTRSRAKAGARPAGWPIPSTQICTSWSADRRPVAGLLERLAARERRRLLGRLLRLEPGQPAADPHDTGDPVRELQRGVHDDRPGPRAPDEAPRGRYQPHRAPPRGPRGSSTGRRPSRSVRSRGCRSGRPGGAQRARPTAGPTGARRRCPAWTSTTALPSPAHCAHRRPPGTSIWPSNSDTPQPSRSRWTTPASGRRQWVIDIAWS